MSETRWWKYLSSLMGNETATEAAKRSGISSSNFTRWKKGARADPDFVVKIARAYEANVLKALVEAEFITEKEAQLTEVTVGGVSLEDASNQQILDEIMRRSDPEARYLFTNDGDDTLIDFDPGPQTDAFTTPVDELAQRRRAEATPGFPETTPDVRGLPYAADDSDTEPEMGDDNYNDGP